jgi:16S rRNA (adenine1518-N6/adenine1519-N6)-dimethyltransferase
MATESLLGPADVRTLAARLGIRPTKQLGQNFVVDPNTIRRIVRAAEVDEHDVVLEIGPGLGSLTLGLLGTGARVVAVEVDPVLAAALPATIASRAPHAAPRCHVVLRDALGLSAADLPEQPTALVANLPYNVAVPVLLRALRELPTVRRALVMVQAEVADRLAANPGSRVYGVPSVKARWYADVRRAGAVSSTVFWPAPHVGSGLVRLDRREPPPTDASREQVFAVVDAAFAQRRKTLRSALAGWAGSPAAAERALRAADVDPGARGEAMSVADFARIARYAPKAQDGPTPTHGPTNPTDANDNAGTAGEERA